MEMYSREYLLKVHALEFAKLVKQARELKNMGYEDMASQCRYEALQMHYMAVERLELCSQEEWEQEVRKARREVRGETLTA